MSVHAKYSKSQSGFSLKEKESPLISVVIPCYNHAHFLPEAIQSIQSQNYKNIEIIVVDDGSTDDTAVVANSYKEVSYIKQGNKGLAAARNTGLRNCKGSYIVFLDADDLLLQEAIETNLNYFLKHPGSAFVSGGYQLISSDFELLPDPDKPLIENNHYKALLQSNYIGMHATVMYCRDKLMRAGGFDTSLKACEDYELYLRLTRIYPVFSHLQKIASYRMHNNNMSGNIPFMLKHAIQVCKMQREHVMDNPKLITLYKRGLKNWKKYYAEEFIQTNKSRILTPATIIFLMRYRPGFILSYTFQKMKKLVKNATPEFMKKFMFRIGLIKYYNPSLGKVSWGDLKRTVPFSRQFGYDRGGPVDRYYIENFLKKDSHLIKGRVLEIGDNEYTLQFGCDKIIRSDVLHVHEGNPVATFVGDITKADHIPSEAFDCIIFTQTLHLIYDIKAAINTCFRILKPGGALLLTVPGISQIDHGEWGGNWLWSFTDRSMRMLFDEVFENSEKRIDTFGNVMAATAFLYGLGSGELKQNELDFNDPDYQLIITVKAIKNSND